MRVLYTLTEEAEIAINNWKKDKTILLDQPSLKIIEILPLIDDLDDINKKYINLDLSNLLDILAVLMKMCNKSKLNLKAKNVKIVQKYVKKEKWYTMSRILCQDEYIDAPQQANPAD